MQKLIAVLAALALAACVKSPSNGPVCEATQQQRCSCADGREGVQACEAGGHAWAACVCADACAQGADCSLMPDLVGKDIEAAGALVTGAGLQLPDPVDGDTFVIEQRVNDPAVQVLAQTPAAGTAVPKGTRIQLRVTYPPDQESLGLPNGNFLVGKLQQDTEESAQAYYDMVDPGPLPRKATLADWKKENGFDRPADEEATALYVSHADLGFGRNMHMRREGRRVAMYVDNYPTIDDAIAGTRYFATVAMEWSPAPGREDGPYYTKFFTFNKKGERITDPALDEHGQKLQPAVCLGCHGGAVSNATVANGGNLGAKFIPFDLDALAFGTKPGTRRADQEDNFKKLNAAVRVTSLEDPDWAGGTSPVTELIEGWYGGPELPRATQDSTFTPAGWAAGAGIYHDVFAHTCRGCHYQREPARAFPTYQQFVDKKALIKTRVFDEGAMPLSQRGHRNFWLSYPWQPRKLAEFLGTSTVPTPGRPIAHLDVLTTLHGPLTPGSPVILDGSASQYAERYVWKQTAGPEVVLAPLQADSRQVAFTTPASGAASLSFELRVGLGTALSDPASATVLSQTAPGAPTNVLASAQPFSALVTWSLPQDDGLSAISKCTVAASPGGVTVVVDGAATQATVTGLLAGLDYTFTVVCANAVGDSPASQPSIAVTLPTAPQAPKNVLAVPGNASAQVSWTAQGNGGSAITGFKITATGANASQVTAEAAANATSANVSGLTNGLAYTFTVVATNAVGDSAASAASSQVTPAAPPSPVTNFVATSQDSAVKLTWTAPSSTGGLPLIGYSIVQTPGNVLQTPSPSATSTTFSGLSNGTQYTFSIIADNGVSQSTAVTASATPAAAPSTVTGVTAQPGTGQATVSWNAAAANGSTITGYTLRAYANPGTAQTLAKTQAFTPSGSPTTFTTAVTGLTNGTQYGFTVTATNGVGTSAESAISNTILVSNTPGAPAQPTGVSAVAAAPAASGQAQQATVSWTAPSFTGSSAITGYRIVATPASGSPVTVNVGASPTSATVGGLTGGLTYTFTVAATNTQGTGDPSIASGGVAIQGPPQAPTGVTSSLSNGTVTVSWTAPTNTGGVGLSGYVVSWAGGSKSVSGTTSTTVTTANGLVYGTTYTFSVAAVNSYGTSSATAAPSSVLFIAPPSQSTFNSVSLSDKAVTATWTLGATNGSALTALTLQAVPTFGGTTKTLSLATNATNNTSTPLSTSNCTSYNLQLVATNAAGTTVTSYGGNPIQTTGLADPVGTVNVAASGAGLTLSWSAPFNNGCSITSYDVEQTAYTWNGSFYSSSVSTFSTGTSTGAALTLMACKYGTTDCAHPNLWAFRVRALNAGGTGSYSSSTGSRRPLISYAATHDNVYGIWSAQGCTSCHTSASGNALVLNTTESTSYTNITTVSGVVNTVTPSSSYLLLCPTGSTTGPCASMGFQVFSTNSPEYRLINQWITDGVQR